MTSTSTAQTSREDLIVEASEELEAAKVAYQTASQTEPLPKIRVQRDKITELGNRLSTLIAEGSNPCPSCGSEPVGILQRVLVNRSGRDAFEVGCPNCRDHHAVGMTVAETVSRWNRGPDGERGWKQPTDGTTLELIDGEVFRVLGLNDRVSCKNTPAPGGTLGG